MVREKQKQSFYALSRYSICPIRNSPQWNVLCQISRETQWGPYKASSGTALWSLGDPGFKGGFKLGSEMMPGLRKRGLVCPWGVTALPFIFCLQRREQAGEKKRDWIPLYSFKWCLSLLFFVGVFYGRFCILDREHKHGFLLSEWFGSEGVEWVFRVVAATVEVMNRVCWYA